jgi:hypothetical protein
LSAAKGVLKPLSFFFGGPPRWLIHPPGLLPS